MRVSPCFIRRFRRSWRFSEAIEMNAPELEPESEKNEDVELAAAASLGSEDATRRSAFLYLLGPATLKGTLAFAEPPSLWNSALAGLQAALVIVIALPLFWLSSFSHLIGYAALGALPALFGRFHSGAGRRRVVAYIHVVDHSSMGMPEVPQRVKDKIRVAFGGTIIYAGGLS